MPPRRSARAKATVSAVEDTSASVISHGVQEPQTPKRGTKRAHSDDEGEASPTKKIKIPADGMPRRPDGTAMKVPIDYMSGFHDASHQVYVDDKGEVYDALLNQTNVGGNNNKFYTLQLIHPRGDASIVTLFTRWGRVGETGQTQSKGPFPAKNAVAEFMKQFKAKAAWDFSKRTTQMPKPNKYTWIERHYEDEGASTSSPKKAKQTDLEAADEEPTEETIPDSKFPVEVQKLVEFIFNPALMQAHLASMNYDANKQPLGKLGKSTLTMGYSALKELAEIIEAPDGPKARSLGGFKKGIDTFTNRYYTLIPHAFGRQRPTPIDNSELLKRELELVESLGEMETTQKINVSTIPEGNTINPLDSKLASLELEDISVVNKQSSEFAAIVKYAKDTNAGMGRWSVNDQMSVLEAFRIERKGEAARWDNGGWSGKAGDGERLLLWHGSRTTNFVGILKQGLRIAPPEAPATGYEFGKGVYFGDMLAISARYTHHTLSEGIGLLLLCEVVARPYHEAYEFDFQANVTSKQLDKVATKALGKMQHEDWVDAGEALGRDDLKGVHMPGGRAKDLSSTFPRPSVKCEDIWNEYIVYDVSQIRIRYLLQVLL